MSTPTPDDRGADERDDRRLLSDHLAGDREAFGVLFARHRDRLWAVALRTLGNPDDAADALQDALISAYRRAGSFRGDAAVTTWLHRVVVNACLDRVRREQVRRADPLPEDLDTGGAAHVRGTVGGPAASWGDPATAAETDERRRRVVAALARLPADQRIALVLVDIEGHSVRDAAAMLEVAPGTIKSRCSRGRTRLAELLDDLRADAGEAGITDAPRNPPPPRDVGSPTARTDDGAGR